MLNSRLAFYSNKKVTLLKVTCTINAIFQRCGFFRIDGRRNYISMTVIHNFYIIKAFDRRKISDAEVLMA